MLSGIFLLLFIPVMLASCSFHTVDSLAENITIGQTYSEVCSVLGNEGTDIGFGEILYEWDFSDRGNIWVWFSEPQKPDFHAPDELVVREFRVVS